MNFSDRPVQATRDVLRCAAPVGRLALRIGPDRFARYHPGKNNHEGEMPVPIIDLFAGPGGLGEGFASLRSKGKPVFRIGLSVEKDPIAHKTLTLRAVFRALRGTPSIRHYYDYIAGRVSEDQFKRAPGVADAFAHALAEARCLELGNTDSIELDVEIKAALAGASVWVLIGGPPCQAYSLAGRSRRAKDKTFSKDEKHFLYMEYLRIIQQHRPTVFVMENVKGLLSSSHSGDPMFAKILADLSNPRAGLEYEIRSFVKKGHGDGLIPYDYVIEAERYGIPQSRHRVILLGVRKDLASFKQPLMAPQTSRVSVRQAIGSLPRIRSRLSRTDDSAELWQAALLNSSAMVKGWEGDVSQITDKMDKAAAEAQSIKSVGAAFIKARRNAARTGGALGEWVTDKRIGGICQHESRAHMASDLARYLFAASFAKAHKHSPRLHIYPPLLVPNHKNAKSADGGTLPFLDRFRVQCAHEPATTVVSHIAKDGHYYIHYDPNQCRSLTVREAARLQTFPDNYYFEGNRTQQYSQVGNAVPPLLARQLAKVVAALMTKVRGTE